MTFDSAHLPSGPSLKPRLPRASRLSLPALALACGCTASVLAAERPRSRPEQAAPLETVTVTAPLNPALEVNVGAFGIKDTLEIPLSIQTYDTQILEDSSSRTLMDVLALDSSVVSASYGSAFDNFRLRGFVIDNFNSIRRDGLSLAPHHDFPLENIERIDVLKGPSGFLYGFNSPGGTVNYLVKRPARDPFLRLSVQGSTLDGRYAAIDASTSTAQERIGYRFNAAYEKNGDFNHARDSERKLAGLAVDFRLGEAALLQVNGDWSWKSTVADPLLRADQSGRVDPLDPASYVLPPKIDRRDLLTGSWYRHRTEGTSIDARLQITLAPGWTWITQVNHSSVERNGGYTDLFDIQPDGEIGFADLYNSRGERFATRSAQSYLSGSLATGRLTHDFFAGIAYKQLEDRSPFWDYVDSTGALGIRGVSVGNVLRPVQPPVLDFGPKQPIEFESDVRERSVFVSDLIAIHERFDVLLGGRYIEYRAEELSASAPPQSKDVFVPSGALIFRPADNLMSYLSYARGFEKGEYAPFLANNADQPTDAIESEQYEAGLKADFATGLDLGIAAFEIRRDATYLNTANDFVSDGLYRHRGVELNVGGTLLERLAVTASAAWLSTELRHVEDPTTRGKRTEGAPRWSGTIEVRYALDGVPGLSVDAAVTHVGSRPVDAQNSGFIGSYSLLDAGISYQTTAGALPVSYRLHGKNLTDEYYYAGVLYAGGLEVGRPREVFLSARLRFQ